MKKVAVICENHLSFEFDFMPDARKKIRNRNVVFVPVLRKIDLQIHDFIWYVLTIPKKNS